MKDGEEVAEPFMRHSFNRENLKSVSKEILCYRGKRKSPDWMDIEPSMISSASPAEPLLSTIDYRLLHDSLHYPGGHVSHRDNIAPKYFRFPDTSAEVRGGCVVWPNGALRLHSVGRRCKSCLPHSLCSLILSTLGRRKTVRVTTLRFRLPTLTSFQGTS